MNFSPFYSLAPCLLSSSLSLPPVFGRWGFISVRRTREFASVGRYTSATPSRGRAQFGIYDYFRKQLLSRKAEEEDEDEDGLLFAPSVGRRLRYSDGTDDGLARKLYLLEEELL